MRFVLSVTLMLLLVISMTSFRQQSPNLFVQFRVLSIPDSDAAKAIDNKMKSKSGILESRTDYVTSTYFCLMSSEVQYTREDFENWFAKLGYEIACYTKGVQNSDIIVSPHVLANCTDETN